MALATCRRAGGYGFRHQVLWSAPHTARSVVPTTATPTPTARPREGCRGFAARARCPREVLGVGRGCTEKEVKEAHRKLAKELHPDANQGSTTSQFLELQQAYGSLLEELKDPYARARSTGPDYDTGARQEYEAARETSSSSSSRVSSAELPFAAVTRLGYLLTGLGIAIVLYGIRSNALDRRQEALDDREFGAKRSRLRQEAAEQRNLEELTRVRRRMKRRADDDDDDDET
eukprot:CAMPEP_0183559934 /NCGR_PEP_ID=MMETSP0371-20130417/93281_1 /TAXON_ID=268820 /ORGANISM="Peridinium aciculiferum, Strain PAER-2" /LENGTH=231 /DNA_ID=CAMNT_0025767965 /DNA_START=83 /DNA_END=778 /DNA_ORIENTATION=+